MYRRRKLEKRYVVIIILLIIMVLFSIFTLGIKDGRKLTILEKSIKDSCLFVGKIVSTPFDFIDEKMKERKEKKNIYKKYKKIISQMVASCQIREWEPENATVSESIENVENTENNDLMIRGTLLDRTR